jgi:hypothetical protein
MDFDRNHFLTDVFETVIHMRGDPVKNLDHAIHEVIEDHVKVLKELAQEEREHLLTMAEQRRKNPREMVKTLWASTNYDRRR